MNYTERVATLADIIMDAAQTLLDPGSSSAQGRSSARTRAHAKLTQAMTAMVSMAQATEAYAMAIEADINRDDSADGDSPDAAQSIAAAMTASSGKSDLPGGPAAQEPNYAKYS